MSSSTNKQGEPMKLCSVAEVTLGKVRFVSLSSTRSRRTKRLGPCLNQFGRDETISSFVLSHRSSERRTQPNPYTPWDAALSWLAKSTLYIESFPGLPQFVLDIFDFLPSMLRVVSHDKIYNLVVTSASRQPKAACNGKRREWFPVPKVFLSQRFSKLKTFQTLDTLASSPLL